MSIKLMTKVWENGPDDRTETIVLLALADRANDDGTSCYPSISDIAQRSRLSEQGVRNVLDRLEESGWIEREEGGGRGKSTHYFIQLGRFEKPPSCLGESEKGKADGGFSDENPQADKQNPQADKQNPKEALGGNRHGTVNKNPPPSASAHADGASSEQEEEKKENLKRTLVDEGVDEEIADEVLDDQTTEDIAAVYRHWRVDDHAGVGLLVAWLRSPEKIERRRTREKGVRFSRPDGWEPPPDPDAEEQDDVDTAAWREQVPGTPEYREKHGD